MPRTDTDLPESFGPAAGVSGPEAPSVAVAPSAQKLASQYFAWAHEATLKGRYDDAIKLALKCCALVPDQMLFRQALRATVKRKFQDRNARQPSPLPLLWAKLCIFGARLIGNHQRLLATCEQALTLRPRDAWVLLQQSRACTRLGLDAIAVWDLECILDVDRRHLPALRALADWNERQGIFEKAAQLWDRIQQLDPTDQEARQHWRALEASVMIQQLDAAAPDAAIGSATAQQTHVGGASGISIKPAVPSAEVLIAELTKKLQSDPADVESYLKLAHTYQSVGQSEDAHALLNQALQVSGGDLRVRELREDVEASLLQRRVEKARFLHRAQTDDPLHERRVRALEMELNDHELDLYRRRSERYPTRRDLKYEFGLRLFRAELLDEAIRQFTAACTDPKCQLRALVALGVCFHAQGDAHQARRCFREALGAPSRIEIEDEEFLQRARRHLAELPEET